MQFKYFTAKHQNKFWLCSAETNKQKQFDLVKHTTIGKWIHYFKDLWIDNISGLELMSWSSRQAPSQLMVFWCQLYFVCISGLSCLINWVWPETLHLFYFSCSGGDRQNSIQHSIEWVLFAWFLTSVKYLLGLRDRKMAKSAKFQFHI